MVSLAKIKAENLEMPSGMMKALNRIDAQEDYSHIRRQAEANNLKPVDLRGFIEEKQQAHRFELHEKLKKEHPILSEYESKLYARGKVTGYMAEKIDKELLVLAKTIKSDKNLSTYLKKNLPGISNRMDSRITQSLNRGIDFDLER